MSILRCSSTDRILACAGSLVETDAPYSPNNPEANEGRAAHEAAQSISRGEQPDLDAVAAKYGVDVDVLAKLMHYAKQAWGEVQQWLPGERRPELGMEAELHAAVVLRGTTDLLAVEGVEHSSQVARMAVLDWKFGWLSTEHPAQVQSYAYLARHTYSMPTSGYILGIEVWVRAGVFRVHKFTAEDLNGHRDKLLEQVGLTGKQYGPSNEACQYCPRQLECRARAEWARSGVTAIEPVAANQPVTRELVGSLYERRKMLGAALARYDEVLDTMLVDGPLALPNGAMLTVEEQEQDSIRPSKAMPYLRDELKCTDFEEDEVLRITKGGLERVMKQRAPYRKGAAYMREAMQRLNELDAVEKVTVRKKKVVKQITKGDSNE